MRLMTSWLWLLLLFLFPSASLAQSYVFAQLTGNPVNTTGWNLQGNAYVGTVSGTSSVILTNATNNQSGAIFFNQAINLAQCTQWTVEFDFRMNGGTMADGIAFCFLDVPPVGFVNGGGLGIPASANGLKVCFDTYNNCGGQGIVPKLEIRWGIGYDECWAQPTLNNLPFIRSPNYNRAKINYNAGVINVYINDVFYLSGNQAFNFTGYFGFTASTGGLTDLHSIKDVVVYTNMPASEAGVDQTICSGETVSIGTTPNLLYTYQWYPSAGLSSATVANPQLTLTNTGGVPYVQTYYVSTAYSSGTGCPGIDSVKITVLPQPHVSISGGPDTACAGSTFYYVASNVNALPDQTFQWLLNGLPIGDDSAYFSSSTLNNGDEITCIMSGPVCGMDTSNAIIVAIIGNTTTEASITASATFICKGTNVVFNASGSPSTISNYQWKKNGLDVGANLPTYSDNNLANGDIVLCLLSFSDSCLSSQTALSNSISIQVETPAKASLGADTGFCPGDFITLYPGNYSQYLWSTGATTSTLDVNATGIYSVVGYSAQGCASFDTIAVNMYAPPDVVLGPPSSLCEGTSRILDPGEYSSYLWNNGTDTRTLVVTGVGNFSVTVTDTKGCKGSGSTSVSSILPLPSAFLPADTAICSYGSIDLKPMANFNEYLWSTNETTSSISINQPGLYWLNAIDANNCSGVDSILVLPKDCLNGFFVPGAFTPNGDGKNDIFKPLLFGNVKKYQFRVFNRWGNIVFQSSEVMKGWDGTIRGSKQASAVFIWSCTYQLENEAERTEKGTFILIR